VADLGDVPASDLYPPADDPGPDPRWPLTLYACPACGLVQLGPGDGPGPEAPAHVVSATARAHGAATVAEVVATQRIAPGATFREHDSGHGDTWVREWERHGLVPASASAPADLVADVHGLMHAPDLGAALDDRAAEVASGGALVAEFFHVRPLVEHTLVDTVRHAHFTYLSVETAARLLATRGLTVTHAVEVPSYGGSARITARRTDERPTVDASVARLVARERAAGVTTVEGVRAFGDRAAERVRELATRLTAWQEGGCRVAAYGAPSKAPVLAAVAGLDGLVRYTVDLSTAKHGRRIPGTRIPIRPIEDLLADRPDVVLLFTWDLAEEVRAGLRDRRTDDSWNPVLLAPLPEPRELRLGS
jgi:hypothetical protein